MPSGRLALGRSGGATGEAWGCGSGRPPARQPGSRGRLLPPPSHRRPRPAGSEAHVSGSDEGGQHAAALAARAGMAPGTRLVTVSAHDIVINVSPDTERLAQRHRRGDVPRRAKTHGWRHRPTGRNPPVRIGAVASRHARTRRFAPTKARVVRLERNSPHCIADHGFRTLVLDRTRKAGILARGASLNKHGENGRGILSRWYPDTPAARLAGIAEHADRIAFAEGDGMQLLEPLLHGWGSDAAVFVGHPYTAGGKRAGSRLYTHNTIDHAALFALLVRRRSNFLMTYDSAPEIVHPVRKHNLAAVSVQMKNVHHNHLTELVIARQPLFA